MAEEGSSSRRHSLARANTYIIGLGWVWGQGGQDSTPPWGSPTGHPLLSKTKELERTYLASSPGPGAATENVLAYCSDLTARKFQGDIVVLERTLSHRLYRMQEANKLVRSLVVMESLQWPPIANWDGETWSTRATDGELRKKQIPDCICRGCEEMGSLPSATKCVLWQEMG